MEQDDENNIDLDTRIAMMFKEKSFGAAPPFLQLEDSESDTEKDGDRSQTADAAGGADNAILAKIKTEMNADNSMDRMMHLAGDSISNDSVSMKSHSADSRRIKREKKAIEDGASDISSDDGMLGDDAPPLPPGFQAIPPPPPMMAGDIKLEDDDDKMSLSSLSSNDDKSNNRKTTVADIDHKSAVPSSMPGYYYPPTGINHPYYYPNGENAPMYDPYSAQGYMQTYMGGFPPIIPGNYVQSTDYPPTAAIAATKQQQQPAAASNDANDEPQKARSECIVAAAIERVKLELKQILIKDFNKRMIESIAFKKYEAWWDEQAQNKTKSSSSSLAA